MTATAPAKPESNTNLPVPAELESNTNLPVPAELESNTNLPVQAELESHPDFPQPTNNENLTDLEQPGEDREHGEVPTAPPEFSSPRLKDASAEIRMGFILKVYSIMTAQLLFTVIVAASMVVYVTESWRDKNIWLVWVSLVMTLILYAVIACCPNVSRRYPINYIVLFLFTTFQSLLVGFISIRYNWQTLVVAMGMTVLIFSGMTIFAWTAKTDFTGSTPFLFAALVVLLVYALVIVGIVAFSGVAVRWLYMLYNLIGAMIFTLYIVYDTQLIIGERGGHKNQFGIDDYVFATLSLYVDVINLFVAMTAVTGSTTTDAS